MLGEKRISKFLTYTGHDLPSLESKIRELRSDVIELEFQKKGSQTDTFPGLDWNTIEPKQN
jgi:hypothetical protein